MKFSDWDIRKIGSNRNSFTKKNELNDFRRR